MVLSERDAFQTSELGLRAIARNYVVDLFGNYPESFGYRPSNGDKILRVQSEWFKGGARSFLEPEPSSLACIATVLGLGGVMYRRRRVPRG